MLLMFKKNRWSCTFEFRKDTGWLKRRVFFSRISCPGRCWHTVRRPPCKHLQCQLCTYIVKQPWGQPWVTQFCLFWWRWTTISKFLRNLNLSLRLALFATLVNCLDYWPFLVIDAACLSFKLWFQSFLVFLIALFTFYLLDKSHRKSLN